MTVSYLPESIVCMQIIPQVTHITTRQQIIGNIQEIKNTHEEIGWQVFHLHNNKQ
jgi:hypothetical protein